MLESGNLTSSLTVLSDLVFLAVYDKTRVESTSDTYADPSDKGRVKDKQDQSVVSTLPSCGHCKTYSGTGHTHGCYCDLVGLDPRGYYDHFEEFGNCPYVQILRDLYNTETETNPTPKSRPEGNDLKQTTIIDITDIDNLLKALFKVNMDIAHREYFLKIDVPEASNWWYGWMDGSNWVSFEPMVELKFSNLHSDNQLDEEENLICTTSTDIGHYPNKLNITPVNRELSYDSSKNKSVQYNDFRYFYDYRRSWKGTLQRQNNGNSLEEISIALDDTQNFYEVKPLCLYENTQLQSPVDPNEFIRHRLG